jgi:tyrosinase
MHYLGAAKHHSNESASLDDILPMGNFAPGIMVKEIMNTESGLLCYRY